MKLFTDARIGQRLGIAFGITLALAAVMVVIGVICLSSINRDIGQLDKVGNPGLRNATEMRTALSDLTFLMGQMATSQDGAAREESKKRIDTLRAGYAANMDYLEKSMNDEAGRQLMTKFKETIRKGKEENNSVIELAMSGKTAEASAKYSGMAKSIEGYMAAANSGHKKVPAFIPVGQEVMERYARKVTGVPQNILLEVFFNRPTTAHILGGCPMSDTIETGVVDKNLKVHGYPDFYITDGSVIQGNIGVNPSLTITAMAEYCMS